MKKRSIIYLLVISFVISTILAACSREEEFDAAGYVKSALDAMYHQEYKEYAKFLDISEEEARADAEEAFQEGIDQEFADFEGITDEGIAQYSELMKKVDGLAKYEVGEAKKNDDGNYVVTVKVEPSDVFQTLESSSAEVSEEKIMQGLDAMDPGVFADVLIESVQKSIDKNTYGEAVTVEVVVAKDDDDVYNLDDSEMEKLGEAMFPTE